MQAQLRESRKSVDDRVVYADVPAVEITGGAEGY